MGGQNCIFIYTFPFNLFFFHNNLNLKLKKNFFFRLTRASRLSAHHLYNMAAVWNDRKETAGCCVYHVGKSTEEEGCPQYYILPNQYLSLNNNGIYRVVTHTHLLVVPAFSTCDTYISLIKI